MKIWYSVIYCLLASQLAFAAVQLTSSLEDGECACPGDTGSVLTCVVESTVTSWDIPQYSILAILSFATLDVPQEEPPFVFLLTSIINGTSTSTATVNMSVCSVDSQSTIDVTCIDGSVVNGESNTTTLCCQGNPISTVSVLQVESIEETTVSPGQMMWNFPLQWNETTSGYTVTITPPPISQSSNNCDSTVTTITCIMESTANNIDIELQLDVYYNFTAAAQNCDGSLPGPITELYINPQLPDIPVIIRSRRTYEGMSLQNPGTLDTIFVTWQPVSSVDISPVVNGTILSYTISRKGVAEMVVGCGVPMCSHTVDSFNDSVSEVTVSVSAMNILGSGDDSSTNSYNATINYVSLELNTTDVCDLIVKCLPAATDDGFTSFMVTVSRHSGQRMLTCQPPNQLTIPLTVPNGTTLSVMIEGTANTEDVIIKGSFVTECDAVEPPGEDDASSDDDSTVIVIGVAGAVAAVVVVGGTGVGIAISIVVFNKRKGGAVDLANQTETVEMKENTSYEVVKIRSNTATQEEAVYNEPDNIQGPGRIYTEGNIAYGPGGIHTGANAAYGHISTSS